MCAFHLQIEAMHNFIFAVPRGLIHIVVSLRLPAPKFVTNLLKSQIASISRLRILLITEQYHDSVPLARVCSPHVLNLNCGSLYRCIRLLRGNTARKPLFASFNKAAAKVVHSRQERG